MKKAAILLVAGAAFSHLPLQDMYVSTVDYFKGSNEVIHGEYSRSLICKECETLMQDDRAVICPKCGSDKLGRQVVAPLYRERGFPLSDVVVGVQFRNKDGSTRIILDKDK